MRINDFCQYVETDCFQISVLCLESDLKTEARAHTLLTEDAHLQLCSLVGLSSVQSLCNISAGKQNNVKLRTLKGRFIISPHTVLTGLDTICLVLNNVCMCVCVCFSHSGWLRPQYTPMPARALLFPLAEQQPSV